MPTDTPPPRPDIEGFLLSSRMPTAKDLHGLAYEFAQYALSLDAALRELAEDGDLKCIEQVHEDDPPPACGRCKWCRARALLTESGPTEDCSVGHEAEIEDPTFEPCGACKACVEDAAEVEAAGVVSVARVPAEPPPTPEGTGTEKDDDDGR